MADVDVLTVEERGIPIRVSRRRPHLDPRRLRAVLGAVAEEMWSAAGPGARGRSPVIGQAEAALPVAYECLAVERAQLEAVETHQVPVVVWRRVRIAELRDA